MKHISVFTGRRRGLALLTVVALLSLFAVIGTAFTFTMRLEEQTARNYQRVAKINEVASIGIEVTAASVYSDKLGYDGIEASGDEFSYYDSNQDTWFFGFAGSPDVNWHFLKNTTQSTRDVFAGVPFLSTHFMARSHLPRIDPRTSPDNGGHTGPAKNKFYNLGVDEDPPGDLNGDGAPGIAGVDDDGDGYADLEDPDVAEALARSREDERLEYIPANDDDEDGLMDEDGPDYGPDGTLLPIGQGFDADGDALGVVDESSKININWVGNLRLTREALRASLAGYHRHNQGATTFEIDPALYFMARDVPRSAAVELARKMILYRNGTRPGNPSVHRLWPGQSGDDNNNNSPGIIRVSRDEGSERVVGNDIDDDGDYKIDEPDEYFIGNRGTGPNSTHPDNRLIYGDGVDNDGDGLVDEYGTDDLLLLDEGIDEPGEFNPAHPKGDDNPFDTLEELRLAGADTGSTNFSDTAFTTEDGVERTYFDLLSAYLTVYSRSTPVSCAWRTNGQSPLNINRLNSYTPYSEVSAPLTIQDILHLQVDNDGDWTLEDDFNGNGQPDFDFDGPQAETNIFDNEDNDGDGIVDDDGDFNQDGLLGYDPEYHLNEDPLGDANGDGFPGIGEGTQLALLLRNFGDDDGDGEADFDDPEVDAAIQPGPKGFRGTEDQRTGDELDNDWNNARWLNDGIDNDFDGRVDETRADELAEGVDPAFARDEGVDEYFAVGLTPPDAIADIIINDLGLEYRDMSSLEKYFPAFDDDEDGRMDEDPPEFDFLVHLVDSIDQLTLTEQPQQGDPGLGPQQADGVTPLQAMRFNPREVQGAYNRVLSAPDPDLPERTVDTDYFDSGKDSGSPYYIDETALPPRISEARGKARGAVDQVYQGSEGVFIGEVMIQPIIVLQPEHSDFIPAFDEDGNADPNTTVSRGIADILPAGPYREDTWWDFAGDGSYFEVSNNPSDTIPGSGPPPLPRVPPSSPEEAEWEFSDIYLPQGEYRAFVYQTENVTDRITEAEVSFMIDGATEVDWTACTFDANGRMETDLTLPKDSANELISLSIKIKVPKDKDGVMTFDRLELFNPYVQYIELVNYSGEEVNLEDYQLAVKGGSVQTISSLDPSPQGCTYLFSGDGNHDYSVAPFDPEADNDEQESYQNRALITRDLDLLGDAYPISADGEDGVPGDILALEDTGDNLEQFWMFLDDTDRDNLKTGYDEISDLDIPYTSQSIQPVTLQLLDPAGNLLDEVVVDFRKKENGTSHGFRAHQRGNPAEGAYEFAGDQLTRNRHFHRLYAWEADAAVAVDDASNAVDIYGADYGFGQRYYDLYWEDDPRYPGRLAFRFGDPASAAPALREVIFFFDLSSRYPDLAYDGTNEYILDTSLGAAPWRVEDATAIPPLVGKSTTPPFSADEMDLRDGQYWKPVQVRGPATLAPPIALNNNRSILIVRLKRPDDWEDATFSHITLSNRGRKDFDKTLYHLSAGTPGRPENLPKLKKPVLRNGRLPSSAYIVRDISTTNPALMPSPEALAELSTRFMTQEKVEVEGLININTAPASVLTALPWMPPRYFEDANLNLEFRFAFHKAIAHRLVEGRGEFQAGTNDVPVSQADVDDDGDGFTDEGPYEEISDILRVLRDPALKDTLESLTYFQGQGFEWTQEEQLAAFARVSGMISVRSSAFTIRSRGRITDLQEGGVEILADRSLMQTIRR
jgi:hypothetical protein